MGEYRDAIEFPQDVRTQATDRQRRKCGLCGKSLSGGAGHHVIPAQTRGADESAAPDEFMKSLDNCVMLHWDCHYEAHGCGKWAEAVINPTYFHYVYGEEKGPEYTRWVARLNRRCRKLYASIFKEYVKGGG